MPQPRVFISYSSKDKTIAVKLVSLLRELGIEVWVDYEQIRLGDSVSGSIEAGLACTDAILLLVSQDFVESRWCRAEYEPILSREIESGRTYVIVVRLDDCELPPLLIAKRYADLRHGIDTEVVEEIAQAIGTGASYSRFQRLVPSTQTSDRHSVLGMIISSTLQKVPVQALGRESLMSGHLFIDLYHTVEALIERFEDLCDQIVEALIKGKIRSGDHQSVYGSAHRLGEVRLRAANRKLASIASDMREIASEIAKILPESSLVREQLGNLLQICASISVVEDFLVVEFGAPLHLSFDTKPRTHWWVPLADQLVDVDEHDSWDNSQKLNEYARILSELHTYKTQLRREIARMSRISE